MSQISGAISTLPGASGTSTKVDAFSSLSSEQFVKIIFAELSKQDPLKPNDSNQLVSQLANIRSIQSDLDMQSRLKELVSQNQLSTAGGLLGVFVRGTSLEFNAVSGVVQAISQTKDGPVLTLADGNRLKFSGITQILGAAPLPPTTPTPTPAVTPPLPVPAPPSVPATPDE
ncbi:MAG: flagellar hook capping FlgD N-terminal domain-containing protein [Phycisphaerales bacterium]